MKDEEHPVCPQCGYDLYGIPETRCPECGFGFDRRALRALANATESTRLVAAEMIIVRAAWAIALAAPTFAAGFGLSGLAYLAAVMIVYVGAYAIWAVVSDAYHGPGSVVHLMTLWCGGFLVYCLILLRAPIIGLLGGTGLLAWAWFLRLHHWPALSAPEADGSNAFRRSILRISVVATCLLGGATALAIFGWLC